MPSFGVSHVNHKVMDKQLSYWIQLIIIGSSKSLGATLPLFRCWNKILRMVVDRRKPNEFAIQWLTTLSVLARFSQMEAEPKAQEELTFWAHHALWRFI